MTHLARLAALAATLFVHASLSAQTFPSGPVRFVVGYPPGGSGDFITRIMGDEMARDLGVAVVVENRPGGGTSIASDAVAKSRPDGQTVLFNWHQAIIKALVKKLPYDPDKDLVPVSRIAAGATVLVVNSAVPAQTLQELIAYARANPGKLNVASGGFGSAPHLASAAFEAAAGVKFTTVQFKGGGPAMQSVLAGDTQVLFGSAPAVMNFVKAGRVRPLVVSMRRGSPSIPGIPGSEEAGLPGFESTFWFGLFVPSGTPQPAVRRLHQAASRALARPEVQTKIASMGMDAAPSASPEAFRAEVGAEGPELERLVRALGARAE